MPIRFRFAAVDGFRPVEFRIAPRNEVAMKVSDVSVSVSVDRVVRRVRMQLHDLLELFIGPRFCARI